MNHQSTENTSPEESAYLSHNTAYQQQVEMSEIKRHMLKAEWLWWLFTILVIVIVLLPILEHVPDFPFFIQNTFLIVTFITFSRYIFFLPITFLARKKWIKVFIIAAAVLFFFVMTTALSDFRNFMDEKGLQTLVTHLHVTEQTRMMNYIKNEMIFFGVGSIITGILLPIRMIISLWRMRNTGNV